MSQTQIGPIFFFQSKMKNNAPVELIDTGWD